MKTIRQIGIGFLTIFFCINFTACSDDDKIKSEGNALLATLKQNKWVYSYVEDWTDTSYGGYYGAGNITLYFLDNNVGYGFQVHRDYDTGLGNSTDEYSWKFTYSISGNKVTCGNSTYTYIGGYLVDGRDYYEPSKMTQSDRERIEKYIEEQKISNSKEEITGIINGHEYADLGLSVKWATCNVGASYPEEYGEYFAWGETSSKFFYDEENSVTYGKSLGDISGVSLYDAARANWGGSWRLPTTEEILELTHECIWVVAMKDGNYGQKVIGPNGNSIFLPYAGYRTGVSRENAGVWGNYWGSTPVSNAQLACCFAFESSIHLLSSGDRYHGYSIRPVTD